MLSYTGHPLVDVGIATICAFSKKESPESLEIKDLDKISDYMAENYIVNPLKSFLTVAFTSNSGYSQPAFDKQPEKRHLYIKQVLKAYRAPSSLDARCIFTGKPAAAVSFDAKEDIKKQLPPGKAFRQHIPLLTGEGCINFFAYGNAGLPVSGEALLAIQAMPLGCAKVGGRLLAVHSDDNSLIYHFASLFLEENRQAILTAQAAGDKKMPESPRNAKTLLVETLLKVIDEQQAHDSQDRPASVTAYHFSNSGQGVALDIYQLPLEISDFLIAAESASYRDSWNIIKKRGWQLVQAKRASKTAATKQKEISKPKFNILYEDLFLLPDTAASFIRRYFLRAPERSRRPGDPRVSYSLKGEANIISWDLTELFLRKVVFMNPNRIENLRNLGDALAKYISEENDKHLLDTIRNVRNYTELRAVIIRTSMKLVKKGDEPLVGFDSFIEAFEQGEDLPYSDWRLAKDLVLIRVIEQLYHAKWLQAHIEEVAEETDLEQEKQEVEDTEKIY